MSYKERLKKMLYGDIYPFAFASTIFSEKLMNALDKAGLNSICIKSPALIDALLTEDEARKIIENL